MKNTLLYCCVMIVFSSLAWGDPPVRKEIFQRALSGGTRVVVVQDPMVPASEFKDLSPAQANRSIQPSGYFTISIELHSDSNSTLRLWSQVVPVVYDGQFDSYEVLDMLQVPDGRIVFATAGSLSSIALMDLSLTAPGRQASLPGKDWSLLAAAIPNKPGRIRAKLVHDEKTGNVSLIVSDHLDGTTQNTTFKQKDGTWEFSPVK